MSFVSEWQLLMNRGSLRDYNNDSSDAVIMSRRDDTYVSIEQAAIMVNELEKDMIVTQLPDIHVYSSFTMLVSYTDKD